MKRKKRVKVSDEGTVLESLFLQILVFKYIFGKLMTSLLHSNCVADGKKSKEEKPKERAREREKQEEKKPKEDQPLRPRPLHRTCSLFMRSIAPTISKAEIIAVSSSNLTVQTY